MNFYNMLDNFQRAYEPVLENYINEILPAVGVMAGAIMLIYVAYKVVRAFLGVSDKIEVETLVRPALILAALSLYNPLVNELLVRPVNLIDELVKEALYDVHPGVKDINSMRQAARSKLQYTQDHDGTPGLGGGINDIIQVNPFLELIHLIVFFVGSIAFGYVLFKQLIIKSVYIVLGPFALAFSLIIGNEKVVVSWFQGFLSVLLWVPVLNLLRAIIILIPVNEEVLANTTPGISAPVHLSGGDIIFSMVFQIVMIFSIFKVPQYANILVSQGASIGQQAGNTIIGQVKGYPQQMWQNRSMRKSMKGGDM